MGDVRWLSPDEQVAWRAYIRGVAVVLETLNQDMETVNGISLHEYEVLSYLSESADWTLRMSTLADLLVHSVRRLESQGYVRRIPCEDDRRGVNCVLTDVGYGKLVEAAPSHVEAVRRCLIDKLGSDNMLELGRLCSLVSDG